MPDDQARSRAVADAAAAAASAGDLAAATALLAEAVALRPGKASWYYRLGLLRMQGADWLGAADALATAAKLGPARPLRLFRLGRARERAWDLAGACEAYAAAVAAAPDRVAWARRLERAHAAMARFRPFQGEVVAHRGRCADGPENALAGLASLVAPVTGVEVDVRLTRDGVAVLMHDRTLERTTGLPGAVDELAYAELSGMFRGGDRPPTLAEYLDSCQGRGLSTILVDVKVPSPQSLKVVAGEVRASAVAQACVVMVRDAEQLGLVRDQADDLRLGCFRTSVRNVEQRIRAAQQYHAELLLVDFGDRQYLRNRRVVELVQSAGLRAGASTINSWRALDAARRDGADVLLTDVAEQLTYFVSAAAR